MEVNPTNYKEFDIKKIKIINNTISYNNSELYFNTPNLKLIQIVDINQKTYLQLKFYKKLSSNIFINTLLATENVIMDSINNNTLFLNSQIIRDINDNIYIKVKMGDSLNNIFDKRKNPVSYQTLNSNQVVKCILKMTNFYIDKSNYKIGYSFELYQLMIID